MVEVLTLFVALVGGPQVVELAVEPPVAAVEVRLDGEPAATLSEPPWRLAVDLGPELAPHLLEVVGRTEDGAAVAEARRWINLTPPGLPAVLRDATPAPGATPLPVVAPRTARRWGTGDLEGAFAAHGQRLQPMLRDEKGAAGEVVMVLDRDSQEGARPLLRRFIERLDESDRLTPTNRKVLLPLRDQDRLSLLWAESAEAAVESRRDLLADSPFMELGSTTPGDRGFSWTLTHWWPLPRLPRIADAVCVAGRLAAASGRPRAVVLLILPGAEDGSLVTAAEARRYLRRLRVPLLVWNPYEDPGELERSWGPVTSIFDIDDFEDAVHRLRRLLAAQTTVWFAGHHLPQEVAPTAESAFRLAGAADSGEGAP